MAQISHLLLNGRKKSQFGPFLLVFMKNGRKQTPPKMAKYRGLANLPFHNMLKSPEIGLENQTRAYQD